MERFFEETLWSKGGIKPDNEIKNGQEEYNSRKLNKDIERAVLLQIQKIVDNKSEIIIEDGMIRVKDYKKIPEKDMKTICRILDTYEFGIYSNHQFEDISKENCENKTKKEYTEWFDKEKESYLYTVPFKQLLNITDYNKEGQYSGAATEMLRLHEYAHELNFKNNGFNNYTILDFRNDLEIYLQPFVLLSLICKDVHLTKIRSNDYAVGTLKKGKGTEKKIAVSYYSKEIFYIEDDKLKYIGNAYEFLFKTLCLPISIVMNSIVLDTYEWPQTDYFKSLEQDSKLLEKVDDLKRNEEYKESVKINRLHKSRFFKSTIDYLDL